MSKDPQVSGSKVGKPRSKILRTKMKSLGMRRMEIKTDPAILIPSEGATRLRTSGSGDEDSEAGADSEAKGSSNCPSDSNLQARRNNGPDQEAGMIPGSFETDDLFDLDLTGIQPQAEISLEN
ncbi:hypothetical protein PHMEG_00031473 [Phytophthora megakarya]|uniref:Uncharacterized protein n=1 Tax=Phytophthora megakarya TaxID=4795 RepID=A0A225V0E0_9STRA|nr:hypothetical protein PHMEG_00031473 [Phytophthora megakarya]